MVFIYDKISCKKALPFISLAILKNKLYDFVISDAFRFSKIKLGKHIINNVKCQLFSVGFAQILKYVSEIREKENWPRHKT